MNNVIMRRMPKYYRKSAIMWGISKGIQSKLKELDEHITEFDYELNVLTARKNLWRYERDLQLTTPPRGGMTLDEWYSLRRGNILAKMRGAGICTESMIISIAESYTDGTVTIDRSCYGKYILRLVFNKIGIPTQINDILVAVSRVKPAHMLLEHKIRLRTWGDVFKGSKSWSDLTQFTWQDILDKEDILNG